MRNVIIITTVYVCPPPYRLCIIIIGKHTYSYTYSVCILDRGGGLPVRTLVVLITHRDTQWEGSGETLFERSAVSLHATDADRM